MAVAISIKVDGRCPFPGQKRLQCRMNHSYDFHHYIKKERRSGGGKKISCEIK